MGVDTLIPLWGFLLPTKKGAPRQIKFLIERTAICPAISMRDLYGGSPCFFNNFFHAFLLICAPYVYTTSKTKMGIFLMI
jgi:hypothetical protein